MGTRRALGRISSSNCPDSPSSTPTARRPSTRPSGSSDRRWRRARCSGSCSAWLFFVPGTALLGGSIGALMGTFNKAGVDAEFRNRVAHLVEPGHPAVVIMASKITEDKFASAMQSFGGTILKTSLSDSDERELAEELSGQS
jgi:hypothetical protein